MCACVGEREKGRRERQRQRAERVKADCGHGAREGCLDVNVLSKASLHAIVVRSETFKRWLGHENSTLLTGVMSPRE